MKIGISTRGLNQGSYAISTIILSLTQAIIALAPDDLEIYLYLNDPAYETHFASAACKRSIKLNSRLLWDHTWLPRALKKDGVEIAFFMKGTLPLSLPCKGAVIFHDLGYFDKVLKPYKWFDTIYMKYMMTRASRKATHIFTDSEYTRQEAIRILGVDPDRTAVCYQNCSAIYKPVTGPETLAAVKTRYHLDYPFIFSPITLSPRKNVTRILNAFGAVKDQIPHHLVISGGQSWGMNDLRGKIQSEIGPRLHIVGTIEEKDMPAIYSMADFTLYPSLIEGFGIPILEAFNCGCPVLTSNITSMPEVAGESAYLVDPYDEDQIAEGILKLGTDAKLRDELIEMGFEQAGLFSWERTAKIILERLLD
ncbi:MAG: glycosyltransferase family 4 protein [Anaerolineales bacterium]|nr:glycosyltransferase family 4 protein [Anaerolineales bacterium]